MKIGHLNYSNVFNVLVDQLGGYITRNGLKSAILGISGGVDSTVVACIIREASIKYKFEFLGYSLPTETTNKVEQNAADLVGSTICSKYLVNNIGYVANNFCLYLLEQMPGCIDFKLSISEKLRFGNIKSRCRMIYLYDYAAKNKGIVVGTDNYTEFLLGFSTIGGDALYDYNPISDLWKTEIYELAEYLRLYYVSKNEFGIAHAIDASIKLTPQDGLGISNSDMDQIGCKNYQEVDKILYALINGLELPENVGNVVNLYNKNAFKRCHPIKIDRNLYVDDRKTKKVENG